MDFSESIRKECDSSTEFLLASTVSERESPLQIAVNLNMALHEGAGN